MNEHEPRHDSSQAATLVEELDEIPDDLVRDRVIGFADTKPPAFADSASRRESLLPIIAVVAGALIVVLALGISIGTFQRRAARTQASATAYFGAEGLVLAEFRRQTEEQLREKDRTIVAALNRLEALHSERDQLESLAEARVAQREAELAAELELRLAEERRRLESTGADSATIEGNIAVLRADSASSIATDLSRLRTEALAEVASKVEGVANQEAELIGVLQNATDERSALLEQVATAQRDAERTSSPLLMAIDQAEIDADPEVAPPAVVEVVPAPATLQGVDPELLAAVSAELQAATRRIAQLTDELESARSQEDSMQADIAGLEAQLQSLRSRLDSGDASAGELAGQVAELEGTKAELERRLATETERTRVAETGLATANSELDSLRSQLRGALAAAAEAEADRATWESRLGAVSQQSRTQALRDSVDAITRFGDGENSTSIAGFLGASPRDRDIALQLLSAVDAVVLAAQRAVLDARLEYRPVGTVSLIDGNEVTVQLVVNLAFGSGALAEIRRSGTAGDISVAGGAVEEVGSQLFTVRIDPSQANLRPAVGDRVFVAIPR